MKQMLVTLVLLFAVTPIAAEVRLPSIVGDHMVLQQQTQNMIWGWADPGETVAIKASWGAEVTTEPDATGRWQALLQTPGHGTGYTLSISASNQVQIQDVAIGEVWVTAGQSNMGWALANTFAAESETELDLPGLRIFRNSREHWHEPRTENLDRQARWKPSDREAAMETSAVSYHFGKTLHLALGVPVGIIQRAYAGSAIESWMPWDVQKHDPHAIAFKQERDEANERLVKRGETEAKALEKFRQALAEYNARIDKGGIAKHAKSIVPPPITRPAGLGMMYPGNVFNAMIYPIRPYGLRGMIWYQGEANSKTAQAAQHYRVQLPQMVEYYRQSWHDLSGGHTDPDFPFYFTQLPGWHAAQTEPVEGIEATWPVNREMMRLVSHELSNSGMAVSIDTGDATLLHPKNKKPIGRRLAYLALKQTYGRDIVPQGPRLAGHAVRGSQLVISFDTAGGGLVAADSASPLDAFAIAGTDQIWHWADARIEGNTIVLSSDAVEEPVAARYAWAMNPSQRNLLYNQAGFPASPFRTDDWPLFEPGAAEVVVDKPRKPDGYVARDWPRPIMKPARQ